VVDLRCSILGFPSSLCWCHVFIVAVTPLPVLVAVNLAKVLNWLVWDVCNGLVHRLWGRGLRDAAAIELIVGIENLEIVGVLSRAISMSNIPVMWGTHLRRFIAEII
jgi:hypothetical protein